jgi:hypothetical protein
MGTPGTFLTLRFRSLSLVPLDNESELGAGCFVESIIWWEEMERGANIHEVYLAFHYSVYDAVICVCAFVVAF